MKQTDIKSLVNYVALKILGGSDYLLDALEEYLVKGEGPATVAYKYNISKHQLRGYAQRIIEKSGSEGKAKKLVPILKEISTDLKPIVKKSNDGSYECSICNIILAKEDSEEHVRKYHKDILNEDINNMISKLEKIKEKLQQNKAVIFTSAS
ncbi:hypothetical protein BFU36_02850 [Sulfolobus sp. A20]|uniref:hypothetical protein n=1 Tax=Sulfolobaceae TaxID=118883 RepID=UPI000845BFBF|nr:MULTISPECIES: hypothetical protein [unclassified Sulfolobus]TRM75565.1 hypothetical protein DJ532_09915 [Sulfolobus sp. A20-N-F8]TRM80667.1 hypothetical protein DJ524_06820 [Sulfolobus sp. D5]TRM83701.1 hypothetical protein DJ522_05920 [Sulfolobus sp. F3]TRM89270.1 hypothetical protein DJ529_02835 [Sulfolobus sp. C3]TRM94473.1 hypothetical protein DJ526_02420 [Sulfolobus sp. A20-N-G8]TRM96379.1 hypothetical protein DJ527_12760 [Sulfolobus sp. F1]TRN02552.1 hypothetical protein DJ530_04185